MPSVVDMIAQAERDAEKIKAEARQKAKSMVETEESLAEADIEKATENAQKEILFRRENARNAGNQAASEIIAAREKESRDHCAHAQQYKEEAVRSIIERLTK